MAHFHLRGCGSLLLYLLRPARVVAQDLCVGDEEKGGADDAGGSHDLEGGNVAAGAVGDHAGNAPEEEGAQVKGQLEAVKICGLRRPQDAEAANRVRPDFAGFILSPGFGRSISPEQALTLRNILVPEIRTVGVFVNEPLEELVRIARLGCIDMIQLHGHESDEDIRKIAAMTGLPVIRAFHISGREDLISAASSSADWVLLDSGAGTGQSFDWALLEQFLREKDSGEHMRSLREEDFREHMQFPRLFPADTRGFWQAACP